MAFQKPTVKSIDVDIANLSIYIRSVKKFGKTTLLCPKQGPLASSIPRQVGCPRNPEPRALLGPFPGSCIPSGWGAWRAESNLE